MEKLPAWLIATDEECSRHFVIRTTEPRFVAELFGEDDEEGILAAPLSFPLEDGRTLANFLWYDEPPADLLPAIVPAEKVLRNHRLSRRKKAASEQ
jgi:hypothetical protein